MHRRQVANRFYQIFTITFGFLFSKDILPPTIVSNRSKKRFFPARLSMINTGQVRNMKWKDKKRKRREGECCDIDGSKSFTCKQPKPKKLETLQIYSQYFKERILVEKCVSVYCFFVYVCLCVCVCVCLCMCVLCICVRLHMCLSVCVSVCVCAYVSVYECVCVCLCVSVSLIFLCLSVCDLCVCVYCFLYVSVCMRVSMCLLCVCVCVSVCLCVSVCVKKVYTIWSYGIPIF